jgi:hypothetical protein
MEGIASQLIFWCNFKVKNIHNGVTFCGSEEKSLELLDVACVNNTAKVLHVRVVKFSLAHVKKRLSELGRLVGSH